MEKIHSEIKKTRKILRNELDLEGKELNKATFSFFLSSINQELESQGKESIKLTNRFKDYLRKIDNLKLDIDIQKLENTPSKIERVYEKLISNNERRKEGQFFTPPKIADFMSSLIPENANKILDPAVGTGIFLEKTLEQKKNPELVAVDKDPLMIDASKIRIGLMGPKNQPLDFICKDFLEEGPTNNNFDAVICNPPYQDFHAHERDKITEFEKKFGVKLSKLSNIYPLFFLQSSKFLKRGGKLIFITPFEFLYTGYGQGLKEFFKKNFEIEGIISFDRSIAVFNGALTTACITVLKKKNENTNNAKFIEVKNPESLNNLTRNLQVKDQNQEIKIKKVPQNSLDPKEKWTRYFEKIDNLKYVDVTVPLKDLAKVKRGIATGHNDFFTLSEDEVKEWGIEKKFLKKVVRNAKQVPHYTFKEEDFEKLKERGDKVFLLYCTEEPSNNLEKYLEYGKMKLKAHKRYLTSHRDPWYSPEKRSPAPILATVFSRENMRFVYNDLKVLHLAAFHSVYPQGMNKKETKALLAYLNSEICLELSKLEKRFYGEGLEKFEPGDMEEIPTLDVRELEKEEIRKLSSLFEKLDHEERGRNKEKILNDINSKIKDILDLKLEKKD